MGSYLFANQYQNEIVPEDTQIFKQGWNRYWQTLSPKLNTFAFVDPAIGQKKENDFTGVSVVSVDTEGNRYVRYAMRFKFTPTDMIEMLFNIDKQFSPMIIGFETVAFQEAMLYFLDQEMRRRGKVLPVTGVKHGTDERKELRIMGLVPYFEWGRYYLTQGLLYLEDELATFPRGAHDDILDSLASMEKIIVVPAKEKIKDEQPNPADATNYEKWYRRQLVKRANRSDSDE
jgi:predicted phage terminase large subunit-like protein